MNLRQVPLCACARTSDVIIGYIYDPFRGQCQFASGHSAVKWCVSDSARSVNRILQRFQRRSTTAPTPCTWSASPEGIYMDLVIHR